MTPIQFSPVNPCLTQINKTSQWAARLRRITSFRDRKVESENTDKFEVIARQIAEWTWDLKALNTVVVDLRGLVSYTDFIIISTGNSERHVRSIAIHVETQMKKTFGIGSYGKEGLDVGRWALVDFGDLLLHVFNGPVREEYDLERMWPEAPRMTFDNSPKELYGHFEMQAFEN